jgi:hypothetical protein
VDTGSGIRIRDWVERSLEEKAGMGLTTGFMFLKKDWTPAKAIYFEEALVEKLEWIQQNTSGIIPLTINLWEEFGVRRSMRRGATMESLNVDIDGTTIDANTENAKIFNATKIYSSLSRFEASVEIFFGHLRGGRGGVSI